MSGTSYAHTTYPVTRSSALISSNPSSTPPMSTCFLHALFPFLPGCECCAGCFERFSRLLLAATDIFAKCEFPAQKELQRKRERGVAWKLSYTDVHNYVRLFSTNASNATSCRSNRTRGFLPLGYTLASSDCRQKRRVLFKMSIATTMMTPTIMPTLARHQPFE